ncbi:MAG: response regulator transcription factor [Bacteroidales bacterium]|nr:response regulator transcription factor [Bacteroidales bacterium]
MENKPKIVIADSQFLVVESLKRLIEEGNKYVLCGIADNRYSLIKLLQLRSPDLLITDFNHIDFEGPHDFKSIMDDFKKLSILILTNQLTNSELGKLLKSGIKNISLKTDEKKDLLTSIEMAVKKKKQFSDQILDMILELSENKNTSSEPSGLTQSEIEIVKLIADGYTTKEIALKKYISSHTVMTHRKNIFRKLEINNVSELIMFAVRKGLIDYIEYNI